jgi:hypothetical protein
VQKARTDGLLTDAEYYDVSRGLDKRAPRLDIAVADVDASSDERLSPETSR